MSTGDFAHEHPVVWTVDGILTESTCRTVVTSARKHPWQSVPNSPWALCRLANPTLQNLVEFNSLAHTPPTLSDGKRCGLSTELQCYRQMPGTKSVSPFSPNTNEDNNSAYRLTLFIYLNDDFEAGNEIFMETGLDISPQIGRGVFYSQAARCEHPELLSGEKYLLSGHIIYRPV